MLRGQEASPRTTLRE